MTTVRCCWILAIVTCVLWSATVRALDGEVYDGSTGKPLVGVYVVGAWDAYPPFAHDACIKVDVVRTDSNGKFSLPSWSGDVTSYLFARETLSAYFYMPGYRRLEGNPHSGERVSMIPDTRQPIERMNDIGMLIGQSDCGSEEKRRAATLPLLRRIASEASQIAETALERVVATDITYWANRLELGEAKADSLRPPREVSIIHQPAKALSPVPNPPIFPSVK